MEEVIQKVKDLIAQGKLSEATELLIQNTLEFEDMQIAFNHFASRISSLTHEKNLGLIAHSEKIINFNQISEGLLSYIYENKERLTGVTKTLSLIERAIAAKQEQDYKVQLKSFATSEKGIERTLDVLHSFFDSLGDKVHYINLKAGLNMVHFPNVLGYGFYSAINFGHKGGLFIKWKVEDLYSLEGAKLVAILYDGPIFPDVQAAFSNRISKELKRLEFSPTLDRELQIKWTSKENIFLEIDNVSDQCFDLILELFI